MRREPNGQIKVAMMAPPWLKVPPTGYGAVERIIENLSKELDGQGIEVELFGVKGSKVRGVKLHEITQNEQFEHIMQPMYDYALPAQCAHVLNCIKAIREDGTFDIIHDHNYFIGPSILSITCAESDIPPAIHTIHGPPLTTDNMIAKGLPDNRPFWRAIGGNNRCYFVPISNALARATPPELAPNLLNTVHNSINPNEFIYPGAIKKRYFITLARFGEDKGQGIAARLCSKLGYRLRMAGTVATIATPRKLLLELANPFSRFRGIPDFKYYSDEVLPYTIRNPRITYSGSIGGRAKIKFITEARALLFPITWDEPFGVSVIEALACGTPVVAMNRGAMPEIIEHGVNGFLANSEEEFGRYMQRVDEIDPENCRKTVKKRFTAETMAKKYIQRYEEVIRKTKPRLKRN